MKSSEIEEPNLLGKVAIVTGSNAGLGYETALALYELGAKVIIACRNESKGLAAIERIRAVHSGGELKFEHLDLSSLSAVRDFSDRVIAKESRLDLLVNNAGVMIPPESKSEDGFELQMGVNFVGHFALTAHLFKLLESTQGARVVTLSSVAHRGAAIDFDNFRLEKPYSPWREYGQSKLANLIFSLELHKRLSQGAFQLISLAAHPGYSKTELQKYMDADVLNSLELMTAKDGAQPTLVACLSPNAKSGEYFGPDGPNETSGKPALAQIDPAALNEDLNRKLWEWAENATGIQFPSEASGSSTS